ncbi:MAG: alpha/beta fold hydrolase [Dermatophilaceae bacterium]
MSRGRPSVFGVGIGLGAAGAAATLGAAGLVADRLRRREDEALPEYASLLEPPTAELVAIATDGVPLYITVDEPPEDAAAEHLGSGAAGPPPRQQPTVVFSHGYCLTSECWVLQRRALKRAGYRVVVWDQRGHGQSGHSVVEGDMMDQLGKDLYAVIQTAAPDGPLALVGHSMGGMTTMSLAEQYPEVIEKRVVAFGCVATSAGGLPLANGAFVASAGKAALERFGPRLFEQLSRRPELVKSVLKANRDLEEFLVERYSFASPVPRSVVRLTAKMILGTELTVMSDFVPTFGGYDKTAALAHFSGVETLVFNGTHDILTPPEHSRSLVDAIPGAEHILIRDGGHVIMLEHPDLLNDQLIGLLERAGRAEERHVDVEHKPRVTQVMSNVAKKRALREGLHGKGRRRAHG